MALAERALSGFAHRGEDLRQQIPHPIVLQFAIAILNPAELRFPFHDFLLERGLIKLLELRLQMVDLVHRGPKAFNFAVVLRSEDSACYVRYRRCHSFWKFRPGRRHREAYRWIPAPAF